MEMKISKTAFVPKNPIFRRSHNTDGSTRVEIQCIYIYGPYDNLFQNISAKVETMIMNIKTTVQICQILFLFSEIGNIFSI